MRAIIHDGAIHLPSSAVFYVAIRNDGCGKVEIGENVTFGYRMAPRLGNGEILLQARESHAVIEIMEGSFLSNNVSIIAMKEVRVGLNCRIGELVSIYDCDFHELDALTRNCSSGKSERVNIGNNVWLGSRVMVLKGVSIGDNSVVAAGSIVTKSIPANVVAAGIPAKTVKSL